MPQITQFQGSLRPIRRRRSSTHAIPSGSINTKISATSPPDASKFSDEFMRERSSFLRNDLPNLFNDTGIDRTAYAGTSSIHAVVISIHILLPRVSHLEASPYGVCADRVEFRDPLTKYDSIQGYLFNIGMLGKAFRPEFVLHDVRQTGPHQLTTRWTMSMNIWWSPIPKYWSPTLEFTGTSVMDLDPASGKFIRHVDTWDSLSSSDQDYLSLPAVADLLGQLTQLYQTPEGLEQPQYTLLRRTSRYDVRRYEPFVVAEYDMTSAADPGTTNRRRSAFQSLARYIFGGNTAGQRMAMTTPVMTRDNRMQFVMGQRLWKNKKGEEEEEEASSLAGLFPDPLGMDREAISIRKVDGGVFAVKKFDGFAPSDEVRVQFGKLRAALTEDGLVVDDDEQGGSPEASGPVGSLPPYATLAQYNDPSTQAKFRRNEIFVPLKSFDLWAGQ